MNRISSLISNVSAHCLIPFFIEYLQTDRRGEVAENVVFNVIDVLDRIERNTGLRCDSFISDYCNFMRPFCFLLKQRKAVLWIFDCVIYCLNNFFKDIVRRIFKDVLKNTLFVLRTVRGKHLLRRLFEVTCTEHIGKVYHIKFHCENKWNSVNLMIGRLLQVKIAMIYLPASLMLDQQRINITHNLEIPNEMVNMINRNEFWSSLPRALNALNITWCCREERWIRWFRLTHRHMDKIVDNIEVGGPVFGTEMLHLETVICAMSSPTFLEDAALFIVAE